METKWKLLHDLNKSRLNLSRVDSYRASSFTELKQDFHVIMVYMSGEVFEYKYEDEDSRDTDMEILDITLGV